MTISEEQIKGVRQLLEEELSDTRREIEEIDQQVRSFADSEILATGVDNHLGDDADGIFEQERLLTIRERICERRTAIEAALQKMDAGTYGICERCGCPIAPERLEALPFVTLCIQCQEEQDRAEERRR